MSRADPADSPLWGAADAYDRYMGRWSRRIAPLFLEWLEPADRGSWLDLGCGTGELSRQIVLRGNPERLVGIDSSAEFLAQARLLVPEAELLQGDAASLPLANGCMDYVVSGLVLNFLPDPGAAVREALRVVRPGGLVGAYVWDYAGQMQIMRHFFDAALSIDPEAARHDDGVRAPICRPRPLLELFEAEGLKEAKVTALDTTAAFVSFDDYWEPFLGGTGSAPRYCSSLPQEMRVRIREAVRGRLPTGPDGEILLAIRAWAVKGTVPS